MAGEKTNAGLCYGLGLPGPPSLNCSFLPASNQTRCVGTGYDYTVNWSGNDFGDAYGTATGAYLATITQSAQGAYDIVTADGEEAFCTVVGDVVTFCLHH